MKKKMSEALSVTLRFDWLHESLSFILPSPFQLERQENIDFKKYPVTNYLHCEILCILFPYH